VPIVNIDYNYGFISNFFIRSNIRDVAKVTQGVLMASRQTIFSPEGMLRLWAHECQRVFSDRFLRTKSQDENRFREILIAKMHESMGKDWAAIMSDALDPKLVRYSLLLLVLL
jgi:hypothetical protein